MMAESAENTIPGFTSYRTVEETFSDLEQLAADNPNIASWLDIGDSYDKVTPGGPPGYDIYALELTNKNTNGSEPKPTLYVMGSFPDQRGANDTSAAADHATGVYIDLHSFGNLILHSWAWTSDPAPNQKQLETLGRKFGYFTGSVVNYSRWKQYPSRFRRRVLGNHNFGKCVAASISVTQVTLIAN